MELDLGRITHDYHTYPRLHISIHRPRQSERYIAIGQLYQGYAGLHLTTDWFALTIWIARESDGTLGQWFRFLREPAA